MTHTRLVITVVIQNDHKSVVLAVLVLDGMSALCQKRTLINI
nr:MAG TPA: hypothetical protein [Caudoviricetes sp.]